MEGHGSGGPSLEPRVRQLEHSVESLHGDMGHVKQTLAVISGQQSSFAKTLESVADKLDAQRTKRPDWGALGTWAAVILTIGALSLTPLAMRLVSAEHDIEKLEATDDSRGLQIGEFAEHNRNTDEWLSHIENRLDRLENRGK